MANDASFLQVAKSARKVPEELLSPDSMLRHDIVCSVFHKFSVKRQMMKRHRTFSKARPYIELQRHSLAFKGIPMVSIRGSSSLAAV